MKNIPLYLFITVFIYFLTFISESFLIKYLSFSPYIYPLLFAVTLLCIYIVINILRTKSCFYFNKLSFIAVVITIFSLSTVNILESTNNIEKVFKYEVLSLNKNLPIMIDRDTRFDKVYFKGDDICYQYTLVNLTSKNTNKDLITLTLTDNIYRKSQIDKMMLRLSKKKRVINYIYHDKDRNYLTKVELKLN